LLRANADGEVICTATLVAPNLALTARHCVAYGGPPFFQCTENGELVPNEWEGGTLGADYPPESIQLFGVDERIEPVALVSSIVSSNTSTICTNDIAYLVLDRDVPLPARAVRSGKPTTNQETVTLVGYGATITGEQLDYLTLNRKRIVDQEIVDVGPDDEGDPVFDAPPRSLLLHGPAACNGDSGGPAFSETTGAVVGVFSILVQSDCSKQNLPLLYTHTSPFAQLTKEAFEAAGATPIAEPADEPDAGADAGAAPEPEPDAGTTPASEEPTSDGGCRVVEGRVATSVFWWLAALIPLARRRARKDAQ
jgi:hypothetical protein